MSSFLKHQLVVSGIDLSTSACELGKHHFPQVAFEVGAYEQTIIPTQEAIYCFDVIHCLAKEIQIAFIQKIYNDLDFGGVAYITVLSNVAQFSEGELKGRTLFTEQALNELCMQTAFQIEAITPHTDIFYYQDGTIKHYPLLCAKLRK